MHDAGVYKPKASCERETKWNKVSKIRLSYSDGLSLLLSHQRFLLKFSNECLDVPLRFFFFSYCRNELHVVAWASVRDRKMALLYIIHCKGETTCHFWPRKMSSDKKHYSHWFCYPVICITPTFIHVYIPLLSQ